MKAPFELAGLVALAGMFPAAPAFAAVNMISVEHRVWGDAGASGGILNTYDETGPAALSGEAFGTGESPFHTEFFYVSSSASDWSVNAFRDGDAFHANAHAQNRYVFKPRSRELSISLSGVIGVWWFENDAQMTLSDLSTDSLVSIYRSPSLTGISPFPDDSLDMRDYPFQWESTVEVDPDHEYELILHVGAHRGEGGRGSALLTLTAIPEPANALLGGMAALLICGRRQR
ncbi:MAG: hypothetical protein MUF86_05890 [Akkermansiaceae bacterium]|jgi:hypothetical protein|nr:hypothetical protein [Akkermansiaceae bacterium]